MKVESRSGDKERQILIGAVTCTKALARLATFYKKDERDAGPLASRWGNLVFSWCVRHIRQYGEAPGRAIKARYDEWRERTPDEEVVKAMRSFLEVLSEEYDHSGDVNAEMIVDMAVTYFNEVKLRRLRDAIDSEMQAGRIDRAMSRAEEFARVQISEETEHEDLLRDEGDVRATFMDNRSEVVVTYEDGLARFFQDLLSRDSFVAFQAPEKAGKSWFLQDIACRGVLQRRRVAFFEVGDMSRRQIKRRILTRFAAHPARSPNDQWPYRIKWPTSIKRPVDRKDHIARVEHEVREFDVALDSDKAWEACQDVMRHHLRSKKSYFRLCVAPSLTVNVDTIRAKLRLWEIEDGWTPDVIVIDYADILAPPVGRMEWRQQIGVTWKQLRALSMERHCLVVTATQADADSYEKILQTRKNFSENKSKYAEVNAMIGINVTPDEKKLGLARLNILAARDMDYNCQKVCYVATCLPLAHPTVLSVF